MWSIRLLILAACGAILARGQVVRVDRENLRAEIAVSVPGGSLSVYLEPVSNLILHTTSLYGLFDGQGAGYALLDDVAAKRAVGPPDSRRSRREGQAFLGAGCHRRL